MESIQKTCDVRDLLYWMEERHRIYLNRKAGKPWPWTQDKILQEYRFCNVFRELDTVTRWIRENWREPYADHPNLWFAMCVARQINRSETLEEIGFPKENIQNYLIQTNNIMKARKQRGEKVYTGAYMIRGNIQAEDGIRQEKADYTCFTVLQKVWNEWEKDTICIVSPEGVETKRDWLKGFPLKTAHKWFLQFEGWGGFMAYEVVTDLRHTRYLENAPDIMTWANAGPGAVRGLNRLAGRPLNKSLASVESNLEMQQLLEELPIFIKEDSPLFGVQLEMRDIEHSLCEFDKYQRVKLGEGRPRSLYRRR